MASDWNIGVTSRVKAMVLAAIRAKIIRNVSLLAQTLLLTMLNDMQVSLLVGFRQVRRLAFGKCEIARWFHKSFSACDLIGCIDMPKKKARSQEWELSCFCALR